MLHSERSTVQIKGRLKSSAFFTSRTSRFTCASFPARFVLGEARFPCSLHPNYQCSLTTNLLLPPKLLCFFRRRLSPLLAANTQSSLRQTCCAPSIKLAVLLPPSSVLSTLLAHRSNLYNTSPSTPPSTALSTSSAQCYAYLRPRSSWAQEIYHGILTGTSNAKLVKRNRLWPRTFQLDPLQTFRP